MWLRGSSGNDSMNASASQFPVMFEGLGGDDSLIGSNFDDMLYGGAGNDTLIGGLGNDTYRFDRTASGTDLINESSGNGEDTLDFDGFTSGVNLDLGSQTLQVVASTLSLTVIGNLENAFGTEYADTLRGNSLNNKLYGLNGDDQLFGEAGADVLAAGRQRIVFLDFDSASESGEYVYTTEQRDLIEARIRADYEPFDIEFTRTRPTTGPYVTVLFNAAVYNPLNQIVLGGISERIGWRELSGTGLVQVDINGFLGTATNKLPSTQENVVALSSTIAAHELAHTYGLRHHDAFGAPGTGIFQGVNNANRFAPFYQGPQAAEETRLHLIASPASIGTTLVDALGNPFFGEREALKLAFAESGVVMSEVPNIEKNVLLQVGTQSVQVQPLGALPAIEVPNTILRGINQAAGSFLSAAAVAVTGSIQLAGNGKSESDYYSFSGNAGDTVTIEVLSQSLRHRYSNFIDSIVRVYNSTGQKVAYYGSPIGAYNDDTFEPTDSILIDLVLPASDTYTIEVDTFSFSSPEFPEYNPTFDVQAFSLANPNNTAVTDRDTGNYELLIYRFNGPPTPVLTGDTLNGGAGPDILIGNSGKEFVFGYNPNEDTVNDPSGVFVSVSNPPVLQTIGNRTALEATELTIALDASDPDGGALPIKLNQWLLSRMQLAQRSIQ